jgi:hypothetical protein
VPWCSSWGIKSDIRLGHGSGSHRLGGAEQERLDVLVAEMVGPAGRCGLVVVIRRVEVGLARDKQLGGALLPAPGRREVQEGGQPTRS